MSTTRNKRLQHKLAAAKALEANAGPIMGLLAGVVEDLGEEVEGLNQFQQDAEMAAELAYRLDNAIKVPNEIIEALDGIVIFFVALAAIGIWRAAARKEQLRGKRLTKLKSRLEEHGSRMAPFHRRDVERRIKRLERLVLRDKAKA
jgi:hypothetical protein